MARPKKTGVDYFPHDVNALNDDKIEALRYKFGNDGYAVYFILLEKIYSSGGIYELPKGARRNILVSKLMIDEELFEKILNECIELELFDKELYKDNKLSSSRIIETIEKINERRFKWRKSRDIEGITEGEELSIGEKIVNEMVRVIGRQPTLFERSELENLYKEFNEELFEAMKKAKMQNKFSIAYLKGILKNKSNVNSKIEKVKTKLMEDRQ